MNSSYAVSDFRTVPCPYEPGDGDETRRYLVLPDEVDYRAVEHLGLLPIR